MIEVFKEGRETGVEHGGGLVFHALRQSGVVIPTVVIRVRDFGPDHFDDLGPRLDETAGEETALAEGVATVGVAQLGIFGVEVEGVAGAARDDEIEGLAVVLVEVVALDRLLDDRHLIGESVAQFSSALEAQGKDVGTELQVVDPDLRHFVHVHVVPVGEEVVGIVGLAEEAGGAPFVDHVGLLNGAGHHDEGEHGLVGGL